MNIIFRSLGILSGLLLSAALCAAEVDTDSAAGGRDMTQERGRFMLTGTMGYRFFDSKAAMDDHVAGSVGAGYLFHSRYAVELRTILSGKSSVESLNGLYRFDGFGRWEPFLLAQVGRTQFKRAGVLDDDFEAGVGAGIFWKLNECVRFRGELNVITYDPVASFGDLVPLLGVELAQCSRHRQSARRLSAVADMPVQPVQAQPAPALAEQQAPEAVGTAAAAADSGAARDNTALILSGASSITLHVNFESGKSDIRGNPDTQLRNVVEFMKTYPSVSMVIEGHTDNRGTDAFNAGLAQRRADTVRLALIKLGIGADRLTAVGYGSRRPLAPNSSDAGRALNRRVMATVSVMTEAERKQD